MEFDFSDIENLTQEELLERLDHNQKTAVFKKGELGKLKEIKNKKKIVITTSPKTFTVPKEELTEEIIEEDDLNDETDEYEDVVDFYHEELKKLDVDKISDLEDELPPRDHYYYKKIILRLLLEYKKEINDINEILDTEGDSLLKEELLELKDDINKNTKMINLLKESLKPQEKEKTEQKQKNNILFDTTAAGNVRVIEELESISPEYYPLFEELFSSIEDGSFKGIKRFTNNNDLKGAIEVRLPRVRVVFTKLSKNDYMVITAFIKKVNFNRGYLLPVKSKYGEYKQKEKDYEEKIKDPSFQEENKEYRERLFSLLENKKKKEKTL